jgi:hypothetical protein
VATERDDELRLASALSASHANTAYRCVTNARDWNTEEVANSSLVPVEAMTAILAAFEGP